MNVISEYSGVSNNHVPSCSHTWMHAGHLNLSLQTGHNLQGPGLSKFETTFYVRTSIPHVGCLPPLTVACMSIWGPPKANHFPTLIGVHQLTSPCNITLMLWLALSNFVVAEVYVRVYDLVIRIMLHGERTHISHVNGAF